LFFVLIATVIIIGDIFKYKNYKQTLIQNYKNKYINKTQQIRENYRLLFDKLQYNFIKTESENVSKINQLLKIYKRDKNNFNIQDAVDELNKDKIFGEYQIFLINKKYIIEKASYKNDLGMDFGQLKVMIDLFDSVFTKKIEIDISPLILDSSSMNFSRYLIKLSDDGKYILQIGFVLDIYKDLQKEYQSIKNIKEFELYIATQHVIQKIDLDKESFSKKTLVESWKDTKAIFLDITKYSGKTSKRVNEILSSDVKNNNIVINQELDTIFTDDKLITHFDLKNSALIIYSITDGLFNKTNETKLIIKSNYSAEELQDDIDRIFNQTILQLFIVLFVFVLMYIFILRKISNKLLKIIDNIKMNQYSDIKNIQVNEIEILNNSYNNLHAVLNQKNEYLQRYTNIIDKHILTSSTDTNEIITSVSEALCNTSGYSKDELIGQNHNIVRHPSVPKQFYEQMRASIKSGNTWAGEILNKKKDGNDYWVEICIEPVKDNNGNIIGYTAIMHDITDKKHIETLSVTDPLTKVYNRLKLDSVLKSEFFRAKRYGDIFSIIMLDIDSFKSVNDIHGHQVGDEVLIEIANLLKSNIRDVDILGRWGGEEFLIISPNINSSGAYKFAEKLRVIIEKHQFPVVKSKTSSFGVASYQSGESIHELTKRVDDALYCAKKNGRNCVEVSN